MTPEQSRHLKIGRLIAQKKSDDLPGTVISVSHAGVRIKWESGKIAGYGHDDMENIRVVK